MWAEKILKFKKFFLIFQICKLAKMWYWASTIIVISPAEICNTKRKLLSVQILISIEKLQTLISRNCYFVTKELFVISSLIVEYFDIYDIGIYLSDDIVGGILMGFFISPTLFSGLLPLRCQTRRKIISLKP